MKSHLPSILPASLCATAILGLSSPAWAGTITAQGSVTGLDHPDQITRVTGSALFDEEPSGNVPLDQYASVGMTIYVDDLANILPGVVEMGASTQPIFAGTGTYFPLPLANGGVANNNIVVYAGAVTFDSTVTQFGLTAGGIGPRYITVWQADGTILGQVTWEPEDGEAGFFGIDTGGVPIAMLTFGNDDIFGGEAYDVQGPGLASDTWVWGDAMACADDTECLDDGWSCTTRSCANGACTYPATTEPCDDDDACTEMDTCTDYVCAGTTVDCDDGLHCTFDTCHIKDGCLHDEIEGCCYTDADCPDGEECVLSSNSCVPLPPPPPPPPPGDGDPDPTGEEDTGGTSGVTTTGFNTDAGGEGGCGCTSDERGGGALAGLLGLLLLAGVGQRRRED